MENLLPLESLPFELAAAVISHLDCHTVRSLLQVSPSLRRRSVLVRDEAVAEFGQFFFDFPDICAVTITEYVGNEELRTSKMIKLVECHQQLENSVHFVEEEDVLLCRVMDDCTFLHVRGALITNRMALLGGSQTFIGNLGRKGSKAIATDNFRDAYRCCQKNEGTTCETAVSALDFLPTAPINTTELYLEDTQQLVPAIPHSQFWLKKLDIQITDGVLSGLCSSSIEALTLTMYDSGSVGLIDNIRIPGLREFKVFYARVLPVFNELVIGPDIPDETHRFFELTETNSAFHGCGSRGYVTDTWTKREHYADMDLKFLASYTDIKFSGTPDFLFETFVLLDDIKQIQWFKTVDYADQDLLIDYGYEYCCDTLRGLYFYTSVPGVLLPQCAFSSLFSLDVHSKAPDLELNGILHCAHDFLATLSVEVQVAESHFGGTGHPTITAEDLSAIASYQLCSLYLIGCYFGDEENTLLRTTDAWPEEHTTQEFMDEICICPVRNRIKSGPGVLPIKLFKDVFMESLERGEDIRIVLAIDRAHPDWLRWDSVVFVSNKDVYERPG